MSRDEYSVNRIRKAVFSDRRDNLGWHLRSFSDWLIGWLMEPYTVYVGPGTYAGRMDLPDGTERIVGARRGRTIFWVHPAIDAEQVDHIDQF